MHRSKHEQWIDLTGFNPDAVKIHPPSAMDLEKIKGSLRYWALVLVSTCLWVALFIIASLYFSHGPQEVNQRPTPTRVAGFSDIEKTGVYIARRSDQRGCDNKQFINELGGNMPVIKYFGLDRDMAKVYNGRRWWFFKHRWMPEVGGICRIVILGHVWEIYRRQPWQELTKQTFSAHSNESER